MCEHCEGRCGCTAREAAGDGGVTGGDGHERMAPAAESSGLWLAASALQEGGKGEVTAEEGEEEGNSGNEETINSPVKWNGKIAWMVLFYRSSHVCGGAEYSYINYHI